ncbi:MAG: HAD-IIIA family hydrolase [bacterium]
MKAKAIFFDRDGVVNERILGGYVRSWGEFAFREGVGEFLQAVKAKGYLAMIVTNQRGVGIGMMSEQELQEIHNRMQAALTDNFGVAFNDIYYCTDADDSSTRRKPSPQMIFEARDKYDLDLASSWMIGDAATDIQAGNQAGTKTAFLINEHEVNPSTATQVIYSLAELLPFL